MSAILFDLDGVLYQQGRVIPGAVETVSWFQQQKIPHLFLTNTTSKPRSTLVEKLAGFGIDTEPEHILTPSLAALRWLKANCEGRIALFVPENTRQEFRELPWLDDEASEGAAAVVVGDLGEAWDFATLNRAFRLLIAEPRPALIALGMTRYWRGPNGLQLDAGPFVCALEYATGGRAHVLGKPAAPFFQAALEAVAQPAAHTIMIGDDIGGDIEPAAVIDSVADLPGWWKAELGL